MMTKTNSTLSLPRTRPAQLLPICNADSLSQTFRRPPLATHAPVPFYWWAGEKLDRQRIAWQLDQLHAKGIRQTVISYPHLPNGENDPGDPPIFSFEWWNLLRWFLKECAKRGMTAGIQDYTLVEPILKDIAAQTPEMQAGQMVCSSCQATSGAHVTLRSEAGHTPICAVAYPIHAGVAVAAQAIELPVPSAETALEWRAPDSPQDGTWLVCLVHAQMGAFDAMHPEAGPLAIAKLYTPFEIECPGEVGKTLNLFFQDELSFGARMPLWSNFLFDAFQQSKGYDLRPLLPALWHDLGPTTEKIRLDYADAVTQRLEDCYFKPVFQWHEQRGTLFGHDNSGRGRMAEGRSFYGDYFRTMRWYSAPGCDDPKLQGARAFKGLKVNSSIAHLNQRPRVWVEAFHSSGWGTKPAEVVAALNEDFAYGASLVNLHGLYYSTRAGWWEWAPPDFHFRQPYWQHCDQLNTYLTRLCWLLSQGIHRCDAAILYPIAALDAQAADPSATGVIAHVGNEAVTSSQEPVLCPETAAFGIGKELISHGCDFDFIDFQSLASATTEAGALVAGTCRYRVLILPAMSAIHTSSLRKALEFVRAGGLVIAYGRLPEATELAGRNDPALTSLLEELFGTSSDVGDQMKSHSHHGLACLLHGPFSKVREMIDESIERSVLPSNPLMVLHRVLDQHEVFYLFNPSDQPLSTEVTFRCSGHAELWNPWNGETQSLPKGNRQHLDLDPRAATLVVFNQSGSGNSTNTSTISAPHPTSSTKTIPLDGPWQCDFQPTLNNRFGDFALPATTTLIGPEARHFRCCERFADGEALRSTTPTPATVTYGPRLEVHGPLAPQTNFAALEKWLLRQATGLEWKPYEFSLHWGIERDPFLTHWLSGPHGLKSQVPDDFIDLDADVEGSVFYVRTTLVSDAGGPHTLICGSRSEYCLWLNGESLLAQPTALPPGLHAPWNIPHYDCEPQSVRCELKPGENTLLLKLVKSAGQRIRAHFALNPPAPDAGALSLRWFRDPTTPTPCLPAPANRLDVTLSALCPPGTQSLEFTAAGPTILTLDATSVPVDIVESLPNGWLRCTATLPTPVTQATEFHLHIAAPATIRGADALAGPVKFSCAPASIPTGDWCDHGLDAYSGCVSYARELQLAEADLTRADGSPYRVWLDLGDVAATAEVTCNGTPVTTLLTPPWRCELTSQLKPGANTVTVTVANTLANHYRYGIPSPYAFDHQTPSGLLGPVSLLLV